MGKRVDEFNSGIEHRSDASEERYAELSGRRAKGRLQPHEQSELNVLRAERRGQGSKYKPPKK